MHSDDLTQKATALWRANGGPLGKVHCQPCQVSGNNRVFRLYSDDDRAVIAKHYFPDPAGGSNRRLIAETAFCQYAARSGVANVPRLVACAPLDHLALHQYIGGHKLTEQEVSVDHVIAAAAFIRALNDPAKMDLANGLPPAAEACFSVAAHFAVVERRLNRLAAVHPDSAIDREACALVARLCAYWERLKFAITQRAGAHGLKLEDELPPRARFISPSDFGFHNALVQDNGEIVFIDFEYAGWDDVAKLAADFFLQPAIPVPSSYYENFVQSILCGRPDEESLTVRIALLRPIFAVKWCCIMLNPFLPDMAARIRFADPSRDDTEVKISRLSRAQNAFDKLAETQWHT